MILTGELQLKDRRIEETTPEKIKVSTGFLLEISWAQLPTEPLSLMLEARRRSKGSSFLYIVILFVVWKLWLFEH